MDDQLAAALARLDRVFAPYPRRAVLDSCPHCRPSTPVNEHDLYSLTISLGNTVGNRDDVKSLLPLLLKRLVSSDELSPTIVLGKLAHQEWHTWPLTEQQAVAEYLDAVWWSLLTEFPSQVGAFIDSAEFLDAASCAGENIDRFLAAWDTILCPAADQHLALMVNGFHFAARRGNARLIDWLRRETVRQRLLKAFERDHNTAWADDLAQAYDLLSVQPLTEQASRARGSS